MIGENLLLAPHGLEGHYTGGILLCSELHLYVFVQQGECNLETPKQYLHADITGAVIASAKAVYDKLGDGFAEKVYHNALCIELEKTDLEFERQYPIRVVYEGQLVGEYIADLFVASRVIVELKAIPKLHVTHDAQLINYLRATGTRVGLLINFGNRFEVRRKVY